MIAPHWSTTDGACIIHLTCSHKKNACAEEDIVCLVVDSAHADTEPAQHQQNGAEDGEHAGGTDYPCGDTGVTLHGFMQIHS